MGQARLVLRSGDGPREVVHEASASHFDRLSNLRARPPLTMSLIPRYCDSVRWAVRLAWSGQLVAARRDAPPPPSQWTVRYGSVLRPPPTRAQGADPATLRRRHPHSRRSSSSCRAYMRGMQRSRRSAQAYPSAPRSSAPTPPSESRRYRQGKRGWCGLTSRASWKRSIRAAARVFNRKEQLAVGPLIEGCIYWSRPRMIAAARSAPGR